MSTIIGYSKAQIYLFDVFDIDFMHLYLVKYKDSQAKVVESNLNLLLWPYIKTVSSLDVG